MKAEFIAMSKNAKVRDFYDRLGLELLDDSEAPAVTVGRSTVSSGVTMGKGFRCLMQIS